MLDIAVKNISARKTRSALCIVGVAICVFLIGIIAGLSNRLEVEITGDVASLSNKMYFQQRGVPYPPFGSSFNQSVGNRILGRDDIKQSESTSTLFVVIEPGETPREAAKVSGVGLTPGKEAAFIGDAHLSEGQATIKGESDNAAILGSSAAVFYDANVGSEFVIRENVGRVVGILDRTGIANIDNAILMSLSFCQTVFGRHNMVSAVLITPSDGHQILDIEEDIESDYPNFEIKTQTEIEEELDATLKTPRAILGMINAVVFAVTIVIIMNVMVMSVKEKTREIGTMRAIGTKRSTVILIVFYETLVLSVIGGVLGMGLIVPGSYVVGISWLPALSPLILLRISALILLIGVFSGWLPAYMATRVSPLEALRYE